MASKSRQKISSKLLFSCLLLITVLIISLISGLYELSIGDIISIIMGEHGGEMSENIFYNIRLVRSIEVMLCGMALATSGYLYQSIFHNALVSPDTLGVSGGASIGAIIAILYFHDNIVLRQVFSFTGGILAVCFSLLLSKLIGRNKNISLLLSGIITGALANSAIMAFKYLADPTTQLAVIDYWLMGSFSLANRTKLLTVALMAIPALIIVILFRHRFKVLLLNEDEAHTLGVNVSVLNTLAISLATLLTAASVSVSGIVSWIGLLTPHIVTLIFHSPFEETLLLSMPIGGAILLLSDTLARTLTMSEIPVSIITSIAGALVLTVYFIVERGSRK